LNRNAGAVKSVDPDESALALSFEDNRIMALLLGEHDAHLAQIEHRLGVAIAKTANWPEPCCCIFIPKPHAAAK
jgi:hypothetical protein